MGDLRNKWRKFERDEAIQQEAARLRALPKPQAPRCQCGFTHQDTPLWQVDRGIFCVNCMPHEMRYYAAWDVANLPEGT